MACVFNLNAQGFTISGSVKTENNEPLYTATVSELITGKGLVTDQEGNFVLSLPERDKYILLISYLGYKTVNDTIFKGNSTNIQRNYSLELLKEKIEDIVVVGNKIRESTFTPIDIKSMTYVPTPSGNIESLVKLLPGVTSGNELSSQYSVRGGSFDENIIYVNDIEVYRPLLVQSAKQEGLSFVNPNMVSSINFSAGAFNAEYGDKMSSVLDIHYRRPDTLNGSISASLLGANLHFEGASKSKKLTHTTGIRYKTTKYVLGSLDTKGEYTPTFIDFQSYLTYDISDNIEVAVLGNISRNQYSLVPETRETSFGSIQQSFGFKVFYEGQEIDIFDTYMGAISLNYRPNRNLSLKYITSGFYTHEIISYDILGEYSIGLATSTGGFQRDSLINIGSGSNLDHARNYLDANLLSNEIVGVWTGRDFKFKWGAKWKREEISESYDKWTFFDSAGYSIPYSSENLLLNTPVKYDTTILRHNYSAFIQGTYSFSGPNADFVTTLGARTYYSNLEKELLISPRGNIVARPYWAPKLNFHLASGIYYQPPFYKEMRDYLGNFYQVKAQRSVHTLLGMDFHFTSWNRKFIFTAEAYYKYMTNIIPFKTDDVEIIYMPNYEAKAYAMGVDFKVYGEFVKGLESWFSFSLLETREDIYNDSYENYKGIVTRPGYYRRASDQLLNLSIFFQDYLPMNPKYRMHLTASITSGLPYSGPDFNIPSQVYNLGSYKRVDIGFSRIIKEKKKGKIGFNDSWISLEILNLFGVKNKISYDWIYTVENNEGVPNVFAVPNNLTGRRFNIKISTKL